MEKILVLFKEKGETPLATMDRWREGHPSYKEATMTYVGRLDPLATGALLVLVGEEVHAKDEYLGLSKEYEFEILFGFSTDTHDVLGIVGGESKNDTTISIEELKKVFDVYIGKHIMKYPVFSSRKVKGKPLFSWFRENRMDEIEVPEHEVEIMSLDVVGERKIEKDILLEEIKRDIGLVKGDFRQNEIIKKWEEVLKDSNHNSFHIVACNISCGSGTYVRSLVHKIGEELGVPALAYRIHRTKIGKYTI